MGVRRLRKGKTDDRSKSRSDVGKLTTTGCNEVAQGAWLFLKFLVSLRRRILTQRNPSEVLKIPDNFPEE